MNMKAVQIMLVVAAVLCAVGLAAGLSGSGQRIDPEDFRPPSWLKSLGGLAGGPSLSPDELERGGRVFPNPLRLGPRQRVRFEVRRSKADNETRRVEFWIRGVPAQDVTIEYEPVAGQRLNGKAVEDQEWPDGEAPRFVVYDRGGVFTFTNRGSDGATIGFED